MSIDQINEEIRSAPSRASYQVAKTIGRLTDCIYDIMQEQGLNNSQLAQKLGRSRAWVGKMLSGDHNMTIKTAVTVFHELGHTLDFAVSPKPEYDLTRINERIMVAGQEYEEMLGKDEYLTAA
ncbi:MAG: helix-turn-helix transcriptional regulator [Armatimonadota bacterium]